MKDLSYIMYMQNIPWTEIMLVLSFVVFVFCCYGCYRIFRKGRILTNMLRKYKKNPELFALELCTSDEIMEEFKKRGQPFLMLMPILSKNREGIESVRVFCGMPPYVALSIMQGVSFMIINGNSGNTE